MVWRMVEGTGSAGPQLNLHWNLSYDNYHANHYYPLQAYTSSRIRRQQQQHRAESQSSAATAIQSAGTGTKITPAFQANSSKMSVPNGEQIAADPVDGELVVGDRISSVSSVLSDTDTAFSEGSAELTEAGEGRYSDFSTPPHSDVDSTYNSDRSSVSTLEGGDCEDQAQFQLGEEEDGEGEGEEQSERDQQHRKKPNISLLLDSPPASYNMNSTSEGVALNGPLGLSDDADSDTDPSAKDSNDGAFYEDREFDFLKAEPVRRSTSLKTYKTPPGTPHRKKAVRFADVLGLDLESVRHILNLEDPPTVPQSAMKDLKIGLEEEHKTEGVRYLTACFSQPGAAPNFYQRVLDEKVVLENCLVDDKDLTVTGTIRVANIAFHKKVIVRCTVNNWLTFEDMCASYVQNSNDGATDRFSFTINVPSYFGVGSKMLFAVMYSAGAQTFWDSNRGKNYGVECYARALPVSEGDNTWMHFL